MIRKSRRFPWKTMILPMSHTRPNDKFGSGWSQHFLHFGAKRWKTWKQLISALYSLFHILVRSDGKCGSTRSQHCSDFFDFRRKNALISSHILWKNQDLRRFPHAARRQIWGRSISALYGFYTFCCEAMWKLAAVDLSIVWALPIIGLEDSRRLL